ALIILRFCVRGFSGKSVVCGCEMPAPRVTRKQSSESSKEEEKIRLVLQEINSKLKTVVQNKENVNAALTPIQSLIDRNKLSIGCKLSGPLRGKVIAMYTNVADVSCKNDASMDRTFGHSPTCLGRCYWLS
uniref:SGF29 C-terminal domain-containing protein n=1 Tax=Parascaris univalens TaxID=6257 RepID=A0A915C5J7_PARUN